MLLPPWTSQGTHSLLSTVPLVLFYDPLLVHTVSGTFRHPKCLVLLIFLE